MPAATAVGIMTVGAVGAAVACSWALLPLAWAAARAVRGAPDGPEVREPLGLTRRFVLVPALGVLAPALGPVEAGTPCVLLTLRFRGGCRIEGDIPPNLLIGVVPDSISAAPFGAVPSRPTRGIATGALLRWSRGTGVGGSAACMNGYERVWLRLRWRRFGAASPCHGPGTAFAARGDLAFRTVSLGARGEGSSPGTIGGHGSEGTGGPNFPPPRASLPHPRASWAFRRGAPGEPAARLGLTRAKGTREEQGLGEVKCR